ncbi:hypothetical protein GCM10020367_20800 [Streptomyces sannanensis]|uniref:Uncharacterized protein n=1 Tax=Streptomyces sannanensis TaxID=285536 RepID=A0ABP6S9J6_9ACTN
MTTLAHLAARLAQVERLLARTSRTAQLAYSSIENGAIEIHDEDGGIRGIVGQQPDGTTGVIAVNGPPPPMPTDPLVEPSLAGLKITWDGAFADAPAAPLDLARVQVHLLPDDIGMPDVRWPTTTIEAASGASVTIALASYDNVWVRLVAVNTSGTPGTPSAAVPAAARKANGDDLTDGIVTDTKLAQAAVTGPKIKAGQVTVDHLYFGANGNIIPDPSFETGLMAERIAGVDGVAVKSGGNGSSNALWLDGNLSANQYRYLRYGMMPITAGDRYWLGGDYKVTSDYVGGGLRLQMRWYDAAKQPLGGDGIVSVDQPTPDNTWRRMSGQVLAPNGAAYAALELRARAGAAAATGAAWWDNIECRPVLSSSTAGGSAEISPAGLRLLDADGEEAVALVTGRPQYLTLSTDGVPVATIDDRGAAGFADLSVAGRLTVGGDPIETLLADSSRGIVAWRLLSTSVTTTNTEMGLLELAFTADPARLYRVVLDCYASASAVGGDAVLYLRDGGAAAPTLSSPQVQSAIYPMSNLLTRVRMEDVRGGSLWGAGTHRVLCSFRNQNGPSGQTLKMLGASAYRGMFYVEDIGPSLPETGVFNNGGASSIPPPQKYQKTYSAAWSGSYSKRSSYNNNWGNKCYQGYYSSGNGIQASLIGFPSSLATDLSGATIIKAEVFLYFDHWFYNSGGKAVIKAHKHTSRPSSFSCDAESQTVDWGKNVGKWVDITAIFDSTSWRGIALDPNSSSSTYYGRARGYGETYAPKLRVTYTK